MLLNESKFKDMRKGKERVTEKNWKYKIDKDLAFRLRDILEDDYDTDYEALRDVMKDIYDNIHRLIPDMFDEDECESAKEDLDILDTEEEDGFYDPDDEEYDFVDTLEDSWNYELSNLYDICDTFSIWIPVRSLDEGAVKKKKVNKKAIKEEYDEEYDEIRSRVHAEVYDIIAGALDNLAIVIGSKVPAYDPEWLVEYDGAADVDKFVEDVVDDLFANYGKANESVKPKKLKESEEDQFCIVAITKEGKKQYYKDGKFVDDKAEATIFNDLDEARSEWFDIDKSKFKRVFVPKYDATKESLDKDGNHETCDNCGTLLTDAGECPKCDLGDEDVNNKKDEGLSNKLKKKGR